MTEHQFPVCIPYGALPASLLSEDQLTNVADLLRTDTAYALLRALGYAESVCGSNASDYDFFRTLCRAMPQLVGNAFAAQCEDLLSRAFELHLPLCVENADAIWFHVAELLYRTPMTGAGLLSHLLDKKTAFCTVPHTALTMPQGIVPVLDGNSMLDLDVSDLQLLTLTVRGILNRFAQMNCRSVAFRLSKEACKIAPDPYHVNEALSAPKRSMEQNAMLTAQIFRILCTECPTLCQRLILCSDAAFTDTHSFLNRMERAVGLPELLWQIDDAREALPILAWGAEATERKVRCAIVSDAYATDFEFFEALRSTAARYPLGALTVLCGRDLRMSAYELARTKRMIQALF